MMWRIPKPDLSAVEVFDICRAGIRNKDLRARLKSVRASIETAADAFDVAASSTEVHLIDGETHVAGVVTAAEMTALYDRHMAREGSRGRETYDDLMIAAVDDMCPFCGHRTVSTLDHCMPKAEHPALAVTPINLVPCCKDCNFDKGNLALLGKEDQLLNAYYDDVTKQEWLTATIVEGAPPGIVYSVAAALPAGMSASMHTRIFNHFEKLGLAKLYASQGGRHLRNIAGSLRTFYKTGGADEVRVDLLRRYQSHFDVDRNSWQTVLYGAAASSDWYCDGGFDAKP